MDWNTFADEMTAIIHQSNFFADFTVDGFVFSEIVEAQMLRQLWQLIVAQLLAEKVTDLFDFSSQILHSMNNQRNTSDTSDAKEINWKFQMFYLFKILVKDKMQIGMMPFVPCVQQVREERSTVNYPFHQDRSYNTRPIENCELGLWRQIWSPWSSYLYPS